MTIISFTGVVLGSTLEMCTVAPSINDQTVNVENSLFNGVVNREPMTLYGMPQDVYIDIRITHPSYMDHLDRVLFTNDEEEYVVWQQSVVQFNPTPAEQGGSTSTGPFVNTEETELVFRDRDETSPPIPRMEVEVDFGLPPEEDSEDNTMRFLVVHDPGCMITVQNAMTAKRIYDGFRTAVIGNHTWMTIPTNVPLSIECAWPEGMVDAINGFGYDDAHNAVSFVKNRVAAPTEAPPEFTGIRAIRL